MQIYLGFPDNFDMEVCVQPIYIKRRAERPSFELNTVSVHRVKLTKSMELQICNDRVFLLEKKVSYSPHFTQIKIKKSATLYTLINWYYIYHTG